MALSGSRNQIFAWSVYDLANTVFSALFITLFFPGFLKNHLGGSERDWGLILGVSTILSILLVPVVGALSDRVGRRMPFLIGFTLFCCAATAGVAFADFRTAFVLAIAANFFYSTAIAVYDALLPKLASEGERGRVSGLGTAVGYLGTPVSIGVVFLLMKLGVIDLDTERGIRATFLVTALLFLLFALYPFAVIREPKVPSGRSFGEELAGALGSIGRTLRILHRIKGFPPFLLGVFLFGNAIYAVIGFLYLYSQERFGLSERQFLGIYMLMALVAAGGSFLSGWLTDRSGARTVLLLEGGLWIAVLVLLMVVTTLPTFVFAGCLGGVALGAHWTATRPMLVQFADPDSMGEYFGFLALVNKASGSVGPLVFGFMTHRYGYTAGLTSLIAFFCVGMVCLLLVRVARPAQALAAEAQERH